MLSRTSLICTKCSSNLYGLSRARPNLDRLSCVVLLPCTRTSQRTFSSKTTSNSSSLAVAPVEKISEVSPTYAPPSTPHFSGADIRELDEGTQIKIHSVSSDLARAQVPSRWRRRWKEILRMEEEEYEGTAVCKKKLPLIERRGEGGTAFKAFAPEKRNNIDVLCVIQADIDLRPDNVRRWLKRLDLYAEIKEQEYNPKRHRVLGNDLAAAHFIVARKGKVKFLGQPTWITQYRTDAKPGVADEDLPIMKFELCTLPVNYDPRFRLEAMDASGVSLHYEGIANFENLHYLKWLSIRDSPYLDDWCLDRMARMFHEKLEFIDLSGCKKVTDKGIGTLHRCKNLKAIRVENMSHLENLEIVCAMLEDHLPNLEVLGIDYEAKAEQLRLEGEELERNALEMENYLEVNTPTLELTSGAPNPDSDDKSALHKGDSRLPLANSR